MSDSAVPEKKWITPFNVFAAVVFAVGLPLIYMRWFHGLSSVTNLNQDVPWGFWIGFDVMAGVALAAGGYVMATAVHLFGMKEYEPVVRPAILTGFLGYVLVIIGVVTVVFGALRGISTVILIGCTGIGLILLGITALLLRERIASLRDQLKDWRA